jgi:hypothetical protein
MSGKLSGEHNFNVLRPLIHHDGSRIGAEVNAPVSTISDDVKIEIKL